MDNSLDLRRGGKRSWQSLECKSGVNSSQVVAYSLLYPNKCFVLLWLSDRPYE